MRYVCDVPKLSLRRVFSCVRDSVIAATAATGVKAVVFIFVFVLSFSFVAVDVDLDVVSTLQLWYLRL